MVWDAFTLLWRDRWLVSACPDGMMPCDAGGCVSAYLWCNHHDDCEDGSDEHHCGYESKDSLTGTRHIDGISIEFENRSNLECSVLKYVERIDVSSTALWCTWTFWAIFKKVHFHQIDAEISGRCPLKDTVHLEISVSLIHALQGIATNFQHALCVIFGRV